jgi:glycosyltransferase involved in cell wall biosynthesis
VTSVRGMDQPLVSVVTMTRWGLVYSRVARWLAAGLREVGAGADVVHLDGPPGFAERGSVREIGLGIRHARSALPGLVQYLTDRRPAVTFATPGAIGAVTVIAGKATGQSVVPWVTTVPRLDSKDIPRYVRPERIVSNVVYSFATRIAAVSGGVRDALAADLPAWIPRERLVVIPNPVDGDEIRRQSRPTAASNGMLRFCSVGRLASAKGLDILIDAFALAALGRAWELVVVGDGPLRQPLERLVRRHGLDDQVTFLGQLANPYPIMGSADIAVQPSRWEGFGVAILEALSLGLPLIATDCPGGVSEILAGGRYGMMVQPGNADQLAGALTRLGDDTELRKTLAHRAPQRAAEYAPVRVAGALVRLANEVTTKARHADEVGP